MSSPTQRTDFLFSCVANSARSQLAEGLARSISPDSIGVHSAGSSPGSLPPLAVATLAELGIGISHHTSKSTDEIPAEHIRHVITLCEEEVCPFFPGDVEQSHWPLPDPAGNGSNSLESFRVARNEIKRRLETLLATERFDSP